MSEEFESDFFDDPDDEPSMTLWSCVLYVIANITGMFLYWLYQQQRAQRLRQEECDYIERTDYSSSNGNLLATNYFSRQNRRAASQSSLLSILGISYNGYKTFYAFEDRFSKFDEVSRACRKAGLETCGLIVGVDFSASNEWQGRKTFAGQNLHKVVPGKILNPYQKVISIMGRTLESFDEDNLIPAFGFGDSVTTGHAVFSFKENERGDEIPCKGFGEVLDRYGDIANKITLGGPTNFAPIINKAVEIVRNLKRYHILIVIADGQVIEQASTIQAIVDASMYPLSIIMVGVGDGPWITMEQFDNCLPERCFDNFQFVNFHAATCRSRKNPDASFALHAMMEIPDQYKTIKMLGYLAGSESHHDLMDVKDDASRALNQSIQSGMRSSDSIHDQSTNPSILIDAHELNQTSLSSSIGNGSKEHSLGSLHIKTGASSPGGWSFRGDARKRHKKGNSLSVD